MDGAALIPGQQLVTNNGGGFGYYPAPNGWACSGTTSTYCNLTAPAPTGGAVGNVNATLPKVDANGEIFFQGPMTVAVQWYIGVYPNVVGLGPSF
jgi:hypothetical protein